MARPTPNAPTDDEAWLLLRVPRNSGHVSLLVGAIAELTNEFEFEREGDQAPFETAETFNRILRDMVYYIPAEIGTFVYSIRDNPPANWIACLGQVLAMADWPELMEVYPAIIKNYPSAGQFFVPNMQGRQFVGSGTDSNGYNWAFLSQGGSRTVTLDSTQIPAHTHGESIAVPAIINGGLEAPASAAVSGTGVTGSAGGGQPHDNMPPYGVCNIYIVGRMLP